MLPNSLPIFIDLAAKASIILAVSAVMAAALHRASASARHFVWTLGLLSALAAPLLSLAVPRWELPLVRVTVAPATQPADDTGTARVDQSAHPAPSFAATRERETTALSAAVPSAPVRRSVPSGSALALFAWIAVASAIVARMLVGLVAVQWMSRRSQAVTVAPWLQQAHELSAELGLRNVRFLRGTSGTMPMAWGIFRPAVMMPADADTWPAHRVRVVLLHELAHVKRRDCLTHLLAQLACAAYWFHPLAWMAARRLRSERERACDDLVLAAGTRGSDYADQLLDIARVMNAGRFPAVLAGASLAMAKRSQLEGRLIAILDPSVTRRGLTRARALAAAAVFAVVMVAVASVQPWAEERAAVEAAVVDAPLPTLQVTERPVEPIAAQAKVTHGAVRGGITGGVTGGAIGGVVAGVVGGVVEGIPGGVRTSVLDAVNTALAEADTLEADKDQEKENVQEKISGKGRARDPRAVNALLEALKDTDKDVRQTAMSVLVQMRDPRMFDPLVAALRDSSADVREQAAVGLGQLRDVRGIEPLAAAIKDQSASVREQVVFALGQLHAAGAIDVLTAALRDPSDDVREQAAFALGQIRDRKSVEPLISALKDQKPDVREQAAFALGQMRDARAVEALVIALKDASASVREQAAFALGQIGDARAIDGLTTALKDASASVRQQAAFALGQIR